MQDRTRNENLRIGYLEMIHAYWKSRHNDGPLFRTLVDGWFAFYMGGPFLTKGPKGPRQKWFNKPDPCKERNAIEKMHFRSFDVVKILDTAASGGEVVDNIVKDHIVPIYVLRSLFFENKFTSVDEVEEFLKTYYIVGAISKSEDQRLIDARLNSTMPVGWDGQDLFARYSALPVPITGLRVAHESLPSASKISEVNEVLS